MVKFSIKEAKDRLSELGRMVEDGEQVVITRNGEPKFELVLHKKKGGTNWAAGEKFLRERGIKKLFSYVAPDFDDPLPEDFLITPLPEDFDKPKRPPANKPIAHSRTGKNEAPARQQHRRSAHPARSR